MVKKLCPWGAIGAICLFSLSLCEKSLAASICAESPSTTDVWDISQGVTVVDSSGARLGSDVRDIFGGRFSATEFERTIFRDDKRGEFVHFVEWQTPSPVQISAFRLFAAGDKPVFNNQREFAKFVLKAKSTNSDTFDLVLFEMVPPHPYVLEEGTTLTLISTNIPTITAQTFRAEFVQFTAGRGFDGPRIVELDGFSGPLSPTTNIRISPSGGVFTNGVRVRIEADSSDLQIRYTRDGSEPTFQSPLYSSELALTRATELRARAFCGNKAVSEIASAFFQRVYGEHDGIPDAWRERYFGPNFSRTDPRVAPDADEDNDGANNLQEFLSGTDPTDPESVFRVTARLVPEVTWQSDTNRSYRVLKRRILDSTNTVVLTPFIKATNSVSTFIDLEASDPFSFYLIEVEQ